MNNNKKEEGKQQGHVTQPSKLPPPKTNKLMSKDNDRLITEHITKPSPLPPPQPQKK